MTQLVDVHVGQKIRQRRWMEGMTLQQLADRVGITAQQIMKYEAGTDEISASLMLDIATALEVPATFVLEDFALAHEDVA